MSDEAEQDDRDIRTKRSEALRDTNQEARA